MKRFFALGALLLVLGATARADDVSVTSQYGGSGYTTSNGEYYAGAFNVSINSGPSFQAFCVDVYDTVGLSAVTYNAKLSYTVANNGPTFPDQGTGVGNELTYLVGTIWRGASLDGAQAAALQTALWYVITAGYTNVPVDNIGNQWNNGPADPTAQAIYQNLLTLLGGHAVSGSDWSYLNTVAAYNSSTPYTGAELITPDPAGPPQAYQTLITFYAPEPSSMAIAGLGALGFLAYGLRRRKVS